MLVYLNISSVNTILICVLLMKRCLNKPALHSMYQLLANYLVIFVMFILIISLSSFIRNDEHPLENGPNVILIMADDLGWSDLGCYGNGIVETPAIDRLASEGVRFTNAYSSAALCSPTRAAILTGKSPAKLGLTNRIAWWESQTSEESYDEHPDKSLKTPVNQPYLPTDETTLAERLHKLGYACAHIGKWHLGGEGHLPTDHGFDLNIGGNYRGDIPSYFQPFNEEELDKAHFPGSRQGEYLTDYEIRKAVEFIKAKADKKFFLNIWHYAVHTPIEATSDLVHKYKCQKRAGARAEYYAMIESIDHGLEAIINVLEETGILDNTVIIFTSDNGGLALPYAANNAPLRAGKGYPYEGGLRVPLIFYYPSAIDPGLSDFPVISHDIFPTIMDLLKVRPGAGDLDGLSFFSELTGEKLSKSRTLVWHFPHYRENQYTVFGEVEPYSIIRHKYDKLIVYYDSNSKDIYQPHCCFLLNHFLS
jgi:arylsulfatase A-like enzyme